MCGIVGFLDKRGGRGQPLGQTLLGLMQALSCRGPDSAGVALFGPGQPHWILQIKLPETGNLPEAARAVQAGLAGGGKVKRSSTVGSYLRAELESQLEPLEIEALVMDAVPGTEVVSLGHQLEIIKQVGSPQSLEETYHIAARTGTHGVGHTRLSTESRVDLSHSQPFWAHGVPDLVSVHNGHVTNYHKLRRQYEQRGYRFFTENDSEVIGVYLRDRMAKGLSFGDVLRSSLDDLDGSFCYLAATGDELAFVKDRFGFKPLMLAETNDFVAIATEEVALRAALGHGFEAKEPAPGTMKVWTVSQEVAHAGVKG